jgi:hypothetical protein
MVQSPSIDDFRFGQITIDGQVYHNDVIILPDRVLPDWWRVEGHSLSMLDLQQALKCAPKVLVVGIGVHSRMKIPKNTQGWIESAGIQLIAEPTDKACETYNHLCDEKSVVAALHLSC